MTQGKTLFTNQANILLIENATVNRSNISKQIFWLISVYKSFFQNNFFATANLQPKNFTSKWSNKKHYFELLEVVHKERVTWRSINHSLHFLRLVICGLFIKELLCDFKLTQYRVIFGLLYANLLNASQFFGPYLSHITRFTCIR